MEKSIHGKINCKRCHTTATESFSEEYSNKTVDEPTDISNIDHIIIADKIVFSNH
jgi:hypothetical protein